MGETSLLGPEQGKPTARFRVAGVSGSLRRSSVNSAFLRQLSRHCPDDLEFAIYDDLGSLPPFNPDLETSEIAAVQKWVSFLRGADLVIICSPEYAHGVSGVLKNALDWLVSDIVLPGRPFAIPNVSTRATIAHSHLEEILRTMSFAVVESCSPRAALEAPLVDLEAAFDGAALRATILERQAALWAEIGGYLRACSLR
ncbi:NADPH-dependent FMN reductase [Methylobacterium phyllosphaerae]